MKSNLKQDLENFRKDFASDINILEKRVHSLQEKFDNYLVPRLQHHDNDFIECKTANSFLTGIQNAVMKLEERVKHLEDDSK